MDRLGGITARRVVMAITAFIVVGGFALALLSGSATGVFGGFSASPASMGPAWKGVGGNFTYNDLGTLQADLNGANPSPYLTQVIGESATVTMTSTLSSTTPPSQGGLTQPVDNITQGSPSNGGGMIEFSSALELKGSSPQQMASSVVDLAYTFGGYVAFQSTYSSSANVVIRVPAATYQVVLAKIEGLGTVVSLTSNSNDVRVQYTDLNATLASLKTEQGALLRLLNQTSTVNSTLAIETQLQGVDQQINEVESQILQTRTLISYATISVNIDQAAQQTPPTMSLTASPKSGKAPLSVTFNAVVKGGTQPYVINYNFDDGSASQGQILIHTFFQSGDYNVTVNVTDQSGNVTSAWTMIHVIAAPTQSGVSTFFGNVGNLLVSVVEGIVEVAVVVLPIAAVGAAVIIPLERRGRAQKNIKQSQ